LFLQKISQSLQQCHQSRQSRQCHQSLIKQSFGSVRTKI
jgi:hypothetical protein